MTRLLRTKDVADRWGILPKTVLRYRREGKIPSVTLPGGRAIRFRLEDIEAIERGVHTSDAHPPTVRGIPTDPD